MIVAVLHSRVTDLERFDADPYPTLGIVADPDSHCTVLVKH